MTGKLDEISRVIGSLEQSSSSLQATFKQHCIDDDRRHTENIAALKANNEAIAKLNETLAPLAKAVEAMQPVLANYQVSRWKKAGAISLLLTVVGLFGWIGQIIIGTFLNWWLHLPK